MTAYPDEHTCFFSCFSVLSRDIRALSVPWGWTAPGHRDVFAWDAGDGALKGFGVRVKPSGIASYFVQHRNQEGRTRRLVLGRVGELTPDEARALAADKLKGVRRGADSSADRHAARTAMTVAELCDLYFTDARSRIKASTLSMDRSRIESHVKPLIGRRAVAAHLRKSGPRRPAPCRHQAAPLSVA